MQTIICFYASGSPSATSLNLRFRHDPKLAEPMHLVDALKEGLTQWLATSYEGGRFLTACDDDPPHEWITATDMLGFRGNPDLDACLAKVGIHEWEEAPADAEDDTWADELLCIWDIEIEWD